MSRFLGQCRHQVQLMGESVGTYIFRCGDRDYIYGTILAKEHHIMYLSKDVTQCEHGVRSH